MAPCKILQSATAVMAPFATASIPSYVVAEPAFESGVVVVVEVGTVTRFRRASRSSLGPRGSGDRGSRTYVAKLRVRRLGRLLRRTWSWSCKWPRYPYSGARARSRRARILIHRRRRWRRGTRSRVASYIRTNELQLSERQNMSSAVRALPRKILRGLGALRSLVPPLRRFVCLREPEHEERRGQCYQRSSPSQLAGSTEHWWCVWSGINVQHQEVAARDTNQRCRQF
ncbi:hypothetical protein OH77DRAFT_243249 [Trametes cingulata]|nr:hypothetical protein OH77DRAFT_243249 [Trametes cingulata]